MKKYSLVIIILMLPLLVIGCREEDIDFAGLNVIIVGEDGEEIAGEILLSKGSEVMEEEGPVAEFAELPTGDYEIRVEHEDYEAIYETIHLGDETTKTITLKEENNNSEDYAEKAEVEKEENEKENSDEVFAINLEINDINDNPLAAKAVIMQDEKIMTSSKASEVSFSDLKSGEYTLNISKDGYQAFEQKIELSDNLDKEITLKEGPIRQEIISSGDTIDIEGLKKDQQAILALTPLDFIKDKEVNSYDLSATYYNFSGSRRDRELKEEDYNSIELLYDDDETAKDLTTELIDQQQGFGQLESSQSYEFKEEKQFFVPELVKRADDKERVEANMVGRGENIYVFVDNRMDITLKEVDKLVAEFDNNIYPTLTELFGSPPDVDNNQRVMVLLTKFNNPLTSGFFNPKDLQEVEGSNYHDLLYLNLAAGAENNLYAALARQFQHLLFHTNKVEAQRKAEDRWLDAGVSKLAEQLTGYIDYSKAGWSWDGGNNWLYSTDDDYPGYFMLTEQISLLEDEISIPQLGAVSLFSSYLKDQYGIELIQELVKSSQAPEKVIEEFTGVDFQQLYLNWVTANVTDSISAINNPIYNYKSFDLKTKPVMIEIDDDYQKDLAIKGGGVEYMKLYGQNSDIQLSITTESDRLGVVKIIKDKE